MKQTASIQELRSLLEPSRSGKNAIGFVPTMGALHEGHIALVRRSVGENELTACSIFVNPTQFNNPDDLVKYPRTLDRDLKMLEEAGCDLVFTPDIEEMYPAGETTDLVLDLGQTDKVLEGKFRPGHFRGVTVIVKKLFDIVEPTRAYFGKKDYQQLVIIQNMVSQLSLPVTVVPCPTVREPDGLAMSSRNMRLTAGERRLAPNIYKVLEEVRQWAGKRPVDDIRVRACNLLAETPEFRVEYFEIANTQTLLPVMDWDDQARAVALTAVFLGDVRLIDNIELFS